MSTKAFMSYILICEFARNFVLLSFQQSCIVMFVLKSSQVPKVYQKVTHHSKPRYMWTVLLCVRQDCRVTGSVPCYSNILVK